MCTCLLSLCLLACGGGDDGGGGGGTPVGTDHTYVISSLDVPTTSEETSMLGADQDMDGTPDNGFGYSLYGISKELNGLTLQATNDELIDQGTTIMLVNLKATDLTDASNAGVWFYGGTENVTPAACDDTGCRKHFSGSAMFETEGSSLPNAPVIGDIANGTFTGDSGKATVKLSILGAAIQIPLQRVGVTLNGISPTGWAANGSQIHGVITETDYKNTVVTQFANALQLSFSADLCFPTGDPAFCSCNELGKGLANLLDDDHNCALSDAEAADFLVYFFSPDLDLDGDGEDESFSAGFGIGGTSGIFTVPTPTQD